MKRILPLIMLLMAATPMAARADIIHRLTSSTQLTTDGALSSASRIGSTYSVSGNNVKVVENAQFGGLTAPGSATAAATQIQADYDVNTAGSAFSFSESFVYGDTVDADGTTVADDGNVTALPAFGNTTTTSGGVPGTLAGTITSAGVMTLTAGGAGTSATGQFVSEITVGN